MKCERSYPIDNDLGRNTIAYRVAPVELGRGGMCFGRTYPVEMHFLSTIQYRVAQASLVRRRRRRRRADLPWSLARHTKVYRVGRAGGPTLEHNFAENVLAHQNPLDHIGNPSGPGGYMKGGIRPPAGRLRALLRALIGRTGSGYRRLSGVVGLPTGPWKGP